MTCTSTRKLHRRLLAAALALPLSLAMTGSALAGDTIPAASAAPVEAGAALASADVAALRTAGADKTADRAADKADTAGKAAGEPAGKAADTAAGNAAAAVDQPAKKADKPATGATAGAVSGKSAAAPAARDSSGTSDKHGTATSGPLTEPQPLSKADKTGTGANPGESCTHSYCSTRDGSPSLNGNGDGAAKGKPCAGCVGKADNKNPKGQAPDGTDRNNGYECDGNSGIGKTNPAHTGCTPSTTPTTAPTCPDGSALPAGGTKDCPRAPGGNGTATMTIAADCRTVLVTSSKDISHVVVFFTDGTSTKFDGLSGKTWTRTFTKDVASARAKSATTVVTAVATGCGSAPITTPTCPDGSAMPAGGATQCPTGGTTPNQPGTNPPPVCPTRHVMGPVMEGCEPATPPRGTLPIGGTTPGQPATNPVPVGPPTTVAPGVVPNSANSPAVITLPAAGPAAAVVPSTLPFTGTDAALLVEFGALLLLAGGGVLVAARRERSARATG